jgi:hypothetical protein
MPSAKDSEATTRRAEAFRERASELRRLANRPEPSSLRGALLSAAREWDDLAERALQELQGKSA